MTTQTQKAKVEIYEVQSRFYVLRDGKTVYCGYDRALAYDIFYAAEKVI